MSGIVKSQRIAGAYLFVGPLEAGKKAAAEAFADQLGCKIQDRFVVEPEGNSLKIEQVRELTKWVRYGPSASAYLVVIIDQADLLTDQAAAAFLKTLEEPAAGVVFILVAEREDKILPTIASRCQKIIFAEPNLKWEKNQLWQDYYQQLQNAQGLTTFAWLGLAAKLAKEKDQIENLLYSLAGFARYNLANFKYSRVILTAVRFIKRRANLKLVLDNMCLQLGEVNGG